MMTETRLLIRQRLHLVDYAVSDFDHDLIIEFSDYGTEANATANISLKNLEKAPVKYFDKNAQ